MTDEEIFSAFRSRVLGNLVDYPLVSPNIDSEPARPYLALDLVVSDRINRSLSAGQEIARGFFQITLVTETNNDVSSSLMGAQAVKDLFPYQLRFDGVLVTRPTVIEKGYRDGPDWRTPVVVRFEA